jgi:phosphoglycolate phosphatase-like HAD superfamily hydrolase
MLYRIAFKMSPFIAFKEKSGIFDLDRVLIDVEEDSHKYIEHTEKVLQKHTKEDEELVEVNYDSDSEEY